MMIEQCHLCEQIFDSKEKLYEHLDVHIESEMKNLTT